VRVPSSIVSHEPLANARGSETLFQSRDREGTVFTTLFQSRDREGAVFEN